MYKKHLPTIFMILFSLLWSCCLLFMVFLILDTYNISWQETCMVIGTTIFAYVCIDLAYCLWDHVRSTVKSEKIQREIDVEHSFRKMGHKWERSE